MVSGSGINNVSGFDESSPKTAKNLYYQIKQSKVFKLFKTS